MERLHRPVAGGGDMEEVERLRLELERTRGALAEARSLLDDPSSRDLAAGRSLDSKGTFLIVRDWMRNELGLRGSDLFVFAILFGFTRHGRPFVGGTRYLTDVCGFSRRSVMSSLKLLRDSELVRAVPNPTCARKLLYEVDLVRTLDVVEGRCGMERLVPGDDLRLPEEETYASPLGESVRGGEGDVENPVAPATGVEKSKRNRTDDWCKNCTEQMIGAKTAPVLVQKLHQSNNLLIEKGDRNEEREETISLPSTARRNDDAETLGCAPRLPGRARGPQRPSIEGHPSRLSPTRGAAGATPGCDPDMPPARDGPRLPKHDRQGGVLFIDVSDNDVGGCGKWVRQR